MARRHSGASVSYPAQRGETRAGKRKKKQKPCATRRRSVPDKLLPGPTILHFRRSTDARISTQAYIKEIGIFIAIAGGEGKEISQMRIWSRA